MKITVISIILLCLATVSLAFDLPAGYRQPVESDMIGNWDLFRKELPEPYHVEEDFDGNGEIDQAWILIRTNEQGWGLFVLLNKKKMITLDISDETYPQRMGISEMPPSSYKTACGKGYWECGQGEPEILELKRPGLSYFLFESAASVFYWDEKVGKFNRIWISD